MRARVDAALTLDAREVPPKVVERLCRMLSFPNPAFLDRLRMGLNPGAELETVCFVEQAGGEAWCLFDQQAYQREEFARAWRPVGPPLQAGSWKELAGLMDMPAESLLDTIGEFNNAVQPGDYDLDRLDGKRTSGLTPPKSNWALPLDEPPYVAIPVTGGITFTFGGLKCDTSARVIDTRGKVMEGLYAAGEPMGEIFYYNYPGASSVIRGAVYGRIAASHAAAQAKV